MTTAALKACREPGCGHVFPASSARTKHEQLQHLESIHRTDECTYEGCGTRWYADGSVFFHQGHAHPRLKTKADKEPYVIHHASPVEGVPEVPPVAAEPPESCALTAVADSAEGSVGELLANYRQQIKIIDDLQNQREQDRTLIRDLSRTLRNAFAECARMLDEYGYPVDEGGSEPVALSAQRTTWRDAFTLATLVPYVAGLSFPRVLEGSTCVVGDNPAREWRGSTGNGITRHSLCVRVDAAGRVWSALRAPLLREGRHGETDQRLAR